MCHPGAPFLVFEFKLISLDSLDFSNCSFEFLQIDWAILHLIKKLSRMNKCSIEKTWKTENSSKISLSGYLLLILQHISFQSFFLISVYLVRVCSLGSDCLNSTLGFTSGKVTFCLSVSLLVGISPYGDNSSTYLKRWVKLNENILKSWLILKDSKYFPNLVHIIIVFNNHFSHRIRYCVVFCHLPTLLFEAGKIFSVIRFLKSF